jgi:hypothetical protein
LGRDFTLKLAATERDTIETQFFAYESAHRHRVFGSFAKRKEEVMSVNPGRLRALSVDDHPLLREAAATFSSSQSDITLVGEACNGQEMIDSSDSIAPTSP